MNMHYLADFDLEGDVCECGEPVRGHPALPKPSSVTEGRGVDALADARFRRYPVFVGPPGEGIQITQPAKPRNRSGRPLTPLLTDELVIAAVREHPEATYTELAGYLGCAPQTIHMRLGRMADVPADVTAWQHRHSKAYRTPAVSPW